MQNEVKTTFPPTAKLEQKVCSSQKGTAFLIASWSQYDEKVIPAIEMAFSRQCYAVDKRYLDQKPNRLGYVNTDEKRARTLIDALSDRNVHYLWFVRGGSGALNLYPALHASRQRISASTPKTLIGFSDVTAIHSFVSHEVNWPGVHGVVALWRCGVVALWRCGVVALWRCGVVASYNKGMHEIDNSKKLSMYNSLNDVFEALSHGINYTGIESINRHTRKTVSGKLDGGNLTLVQSLFSTIFEASYSDKIMMLEDTGVTPKQLDRTLHQIDVQPKISPTRCYFWSVLRSECQRRRKIALPICDKTVRRAR